MITVKKFYQQKQQIAVLQHKNLIKLTNKIIIFIYWVRVQANPKMKVTKLTDQIKINLYHTTRSL